MKRCLSGSFDVFNLSYILPLYLFLIPLSVVHSSQLPMASSSFSLALQCGFVMDDGEVAESLHACWSLVWVSSKRMVEGSSTEY